MVLAEFEQGRQKAIEEVNAYLRENFQVDSYNRIAPVVLLQKRADEPHMGGISTYSR